MAELSALFDWCFRPRGFEESGRVYRSLGIELLGKIVRATAGSFVLLLRPRQELYSYFVTHPLAVESVKRTERWSRFNEVVHVLFTGFCIVMAVRLAQRGLAGGVIFMTLFGLLNFGLVLLQRLNRTKLYHMLALLERRQKQQTQ
jgi:hypothetical protein